MKMKYAGASVLIFFSSLLLFSQGHQKLSYDDLLRQIELHEGSPKVWVYLNSYRDKAMAEGNYTETVEAYREMLHECDQKLCIAYADSMLIAAKQSGINDLIGSSYLTKGIVYFQRRQHQRALDNYVLANKYLVKGNDIYLRHKVKYSIAQIKYYLGYYNEAISLFSECTAYFKEEEPLPYLKSLHSLALCYASLDSITLSDSLNKLTFTESTRLGIRDMLPYIDNTNGIIQFKRKNYREAIKNISYALPEIRKDRDFANDAIASLFLGKAYWNLGQRDTAVTHFKAVDKIFTEMKYMRPDLRENYEYLIKYYHHKKVPDMELRYIDQLLKADSVLGKDFRYLVKKIHKEYDTAELLAEKQKIQEELSSSRWYGYIYKGAAVLLTAVLGFTVWRHRKLKKIHKQRFEELISSNVNPVTELQAHSEELDINPAIVNHIVGKLDEFENKKGYLKKDMTAMKLAENFKTNYKYLSRVIRCHKEKSFINYINDLRIDYLVERLKAEPMLRRYTNGALAEEAGFSTAQHFVTAFKKRTKISPSYFINELDKLPSKDEAIVQH